MIDKNITRYIDVIFCLVLIPVMVLMLPIERWLENDSTFVVLLITWLYLVYIIHRSITVPSAFSSNPNGVLLAVALLIITIGLTYLLGQYKLYVPEHMQQARNAAAAVLNESVGSGGGGGGGGGAPKRALDGNRMMQQQAIWFLYVVVTTFSMVVALLSQINRHIVARQNVEFEKKRAELSLYKAQINPHFLFNTLNTLLGLVVTKSDKAEDAIVQFTSLMRYMCSSSTQDHVALRTEVEYIEEYISIQRYRLSEHTNVNFKVSIANDSRSCQIAPMLLITFIENALKYGASSQFPSDVDVEINVNGGVLELRTSNPIFSTHNSREVSSGIGILNCRKRLELLYLGRYDLKIDEGNDRYSVLLTIKLV
ncbi:MAG: histidine kinase [Rikenellaceae bacterium]